MIDILPIITVIVCYFIGNISPAILIGRMNGVEIRSKGSGNAGTTNVLRVLGKKAAAATMIIDILKGVVPVLLGRYIGGQELAMACGLAAFLGHIWPMLFGFRGGKGIATAFGLFLALEPLLGLIEAVTISAFVLISKRVSVGSLAAAIVLPFASYLFNPRYLIITVPMALITIYKHRLNIKRLVNGEEPKINLKKREEKQ